MRDGTTGASLFRQGLPWVMAVSLLLATAAMYRSVGDFQFVNYDDDSYVYRNPAVLRGLEAAGVRWAFFGAHAANYHPVTWLSHMLDAELFGKDPGPQHLVNLLFHLANTAVLFLLLRRMTGAAWRSYFAAALFALHPLHVESTAWISERKDVLSGLFFLTSIWAYVWWTARRSAARYLLLVLLFILGLMAKPTLVTLPLLLLLLDGWPLGRWTARPHRLLLEKAPLFLIAAVFSVITYIVHEGAVAPLTQVPLPDRLANAVVVYGAYLRKTVWPNDLAVFYPYPATIAWGALAVSAVALLGISAAVVLRRRSSGFLTTGWLWYLIMLVPMQGLVQVGAQAMADRYTYLSLVGIFVAVVWGTAELSRGWPWRRGVLAATAGLVFTGLTVTGHRQVGFWRDSGTLFSRALAVTDDNLVAHVNLGIHLKEHGRLEEAIAQYRKAVRINPYHPDVHYNLANALVAIGRFAESVEPYLQAVRLDPDDPDAPGNLANVLNRLGRYREADRYAAESQRRRNP